MQYGQYGEGRGLGGTSKVHVALDESQLLVHHVIQAPRGGAPLPPRLSVLLSLTLNLSPSLPYWEGHGLGGTSKVWRLVPSIAHAQVSRVGAFGFAGRGRDVVGWGGGGGAPTKYMSLSMNANCSCITSFKRRKGGYPFYRVFLSSCL